MGRRHEGRRRSAARLVTADLQPVATLAYMDRVMDRPGHQPQHLAFEFAQEHQPIGSGGGRGAGRVIANLARNAIIRVIFLHISGRELAPDVADGPCRASVDEAEGTVRTGATLTEIVWSNTLPDARHGRIPPTLMAALHPPSFALLARKAVPAVTIST